MKNISSPKKFVIDAPVANKMEIVRRMSNLTGFRIDMCSVLYDAFVNAVKESIVEGNHVNIKGLASFTLQETVGRDVLLYGKTIYARPKRKLAIKMSPTLVQELEKIIIEDPNAESDDG